MKVAVLKLGGRIANAEHGITSFEAVSVCKMLSNGGLQADCFTKLSIRDKYIPGLNISDISKHHDKISGNYDALIVLNGNINFYGGVENPEQLLNLKIINNFDGPVFYIFIDTLLPLKNVWKSVNAKPWGSKYKEEDINITRDDITYITMCYDTKSVLDITGKTGINPKEVVYFPFEKYAFFGERLQYIGDKEFDLMYGANSFRNKREKKIIKYYLDLPEDINVSFYGKMKVKDFKPKLVENKRFPNFYPPVKYKDNLTELNKSIATINISDNFNEGTQLNPRVYETVLANVVSFMDIDYDPQKRAFKNPSLQKFLYVNNQEELVNRLRILKEKPNIMKEIIDLQYKDSYISTSQLSSDFCNLIKSLV